MGLGALDVSVTALGLLPLLALPHVGLLGVGQFPGASTKIWNGPRNRSEVDSNKAVRMTIAEAGGYASADIASVSGKARVAKMLGHQYFPECSGSGYFHASLLGVIREAEPGQRRGYDIEGVRWIAAVGRRICQ